MWQRRGVRILTIALGIFVINGLTRLVSRLGRPDETATSAYETVDKTDWTVIALVGVGGVIALVGIFAAVWSITQPFSRVFFDLAAASLIGALLSLLVGPFIGGTGVFDDQLEGFVLQFLQFLLFCGIGIFLGHVVMIALGKDWKSRGLKEYALRHGGARKPHRVGR